MITIRADWTLDVPEEERGIGWAGENEVERRVFVLPEGYGEDWVYRLDLRLADGSADIVLLEPEEGTLTWEITARHLDLRGAKNGYVYAQIRADKGERVKKSSVAQFRVTRSIEASGTVEVNPSEIEQAEERMNALLLGAQEAEAGAEEAQAGAEGSAAQAQAAQAAAESAREAAETARDEAEEAAGQTAADREAAGKDRAEVEKLAAQAAADAAQVAADKGTVAGDRLAADEAKTAAEAARDEAQRQAGLAAGSADGAAEAIAAFTDTTLPDAVEQVTEAGAAQAALAEAAADRAEAAAERAEGIDGWTKGEADDRFANALRGTASGMAVRLDDVSPIGAFSRLAAVGATTETGTGEKGPGNPYTLVGAKPTALTLCGKNLYVDRIEAYSKPMDYWICPVSLVQGCTYTLSASRIGSQIADCTVAFATGGDDYAEFNTPPNQFIILVAYDGTTWKKTFTVDAAFTAPVLAIFASDRAAFEKLFANYAIQLELGDAATAYEPYADTAEHALPEGLELYGGFGVCDEYDAVTGVKTQRWKRLEFDGTEDWQTAVSEDAGFSLNLSAGEAAKEKAITELYCSHFPPSYGGAIPMEGRCYLLSTGLALLLYPPTDSLLDTVEAFKAWLAAQAEAGTPVTVAYQLAEETEEALAEPARIAPPAPVCQVYADAGTVEVAYNRDVNLAMAGMDKRIAALEEALAALLEG